MDLPVDTLTTDPRTSARHVRLTPPSPTPDGAATLAVEVLADIAAGLARATALWRPHVAHDPLSRTALRLIATEAYEVWLLGWCTGQSVELHDHGGANAAFAVLEGELEEITLGFAGSTTRRHAAGAITTVPAGVVHDVVNREEAPATSLHVYSDPLRSMTFFDPSGRPRQVESVPALVSSREQARALHPARLAHPGDPR